MSVPLIYIDAAADLQALLPRHKVRFFERAERNLGEAIERGIHAYTDGVWQRVFRPEEQNSEGRAVLEAVRSEITVGARGGVKVDLQGLRMRGRRKRREWWDAQYLALGWEAHPHATPEDRAREISRTVNALSGEEFCALRSAATRAGDPAALARLVRRFCPSITPAEVAEHFCK